MAPTEPETAPSPAENVPASHERALAVLLYPGTAPLLRWLLRRRWTPFLEHHHRRALALAALLSGLALLFVLVVLALSWLMSAHGDLYNTGNYEAWTMSIFRKLLIVWGVFWAYGMLLAARGSAAPIPWLDHIINRRLVQITGREATRIAYGLAVCAVLVVTLVNRVAPNRITEAPACLLYENVGGRYPRALFALGYFPTVLAARKHWGPGGVTLQPLSEETLRAALAHAEFVFVGSHGTEQGLLLETGYVAPTDLRDAPLNPGLNYVYLAGCDSGARRREWEEALAPARVVTQDRLAPTVQHLWWLWHHGPRVIETLPKGSPAEE